MSLPPLIAEHYFAFRTLLVPIQPVMKQTQKHNFLLSTASFTE